MLSAVADYKFVEPQNILIDGGLMPLRQGGLKKVLRGEDAAFLREAACRIAYLEYEVSSNSAPYWEYFTQTTGPKCGGICNQSIVAEPLRFSNQTFINCIGFFAADFMPSSSYISYDTGNPPVSYAYSLPDLLNLDIDPTIIPDHTANLQSGRPFMIAPIEELVDCVSAFAHPTMRSQTAQFTSSAAGVSNQWTASCNRNYIYESEGDNYSPNRQRYNLEAVYSECVHYQENTSWAAYNGSRTWCWNKNFPNEWYTALYCPQPYGLQWTDRDGAVHQPDDTLTPALIENSWEWTQAIFQFRIIEDWQIARNDRTWKEKHIDKRVLIPVELNHQDLDGGRWTFNVVDMYNKGWQALSIAGGEYVSIAYLQSQGMAANDYAGGSTSVRLEAVHGIYTMNEDLVVAHPT